MQKLANQYAQVIKIILYVRVCPALAQEFFSAGTGSEFNIIFQAHG